MCPHQLSRQQDEAITFLNITCKGTRQITYIHAEVLCKAVHVHLTTITQILGPFCILIIIKIEANTMSSLSFHIGHTCAGQLLNTITCSPAIALQRLVLISSSGFSTSVEVIKWCKIQIIMHILLQTFQTSTFPTTVLKSLDHKPVREMKNTAFNTVSFLSVV